MCFVFAQELLHFHALCKIVYSLCCLSPFLLHILVDMYELRVNFIYTQSYMSRQLRRSWHM